MPEMPEKHLYEYAVVRVVPRVEREEFLNVGVVLYCPSLRYLEVTFWLNPQRLKAVCPTLDVDELEAYLMAFARICTGGKEGGTIGQLPPASRFRWLTATRSSVLRPQKCIPDFVPMPRKLSLD